MTFTTVDQNVDHDNDGNSYMTTMNGKMCQNQIILALYKNRELTCAQGAPILNPNATQRIGSQFRGTLLLQDVNLIEIIQSLDRERVPER